MDSMPPSFATRRRVYSPAFGACCYRVGERVIAGARRPRISLRVGSHCDCRCGGLGHECSQQTRSPHDPLGLANSNIDQLRTVKSLTRSGDLDRPGRGNGGDVCALSEPLGGKDIEHDASGPGICGFREAAAGSCWTDVAKLEASLQQLGGEGPDGSRGFEPR